MSLKSGNNHTANPWPHEDKRSVEQAFLRLGDVLAEIASGSNQAIARMGEDTSRDKESLTETSQPHVTDIANARTDKRTTVKIRSTR